MRLLFSEYKSDYQHYIFPYAIWALPDDEHSPDDLFGAGFLPSSRQLDRFYMCRHIRVRLADFSTSSENRRIFRKGEHVEHRLLKRDEFDFTSEWRQFCHEYTKARFKGEAMSSERLDELFSSPVCSHVLEFYERETQKSLGIVVLYLNHPGVAFYYYSFYDLEAFKNLGMYMMTATVQTMQEQGFEYIYLGSCYSRSALYKTQFSGCEFWNGFRWSDDVKELKFMIERDQQPVESHLLENPDFVDSFYPKGFGS